MLNQNGHRIFTEDPFKNLKFAAILLGVMFVFMSVFVVYYGTSNEVSEYQEWSSTGIILLLGLTFSGCLLLAFIILCFQHSRTVICSATECEIYISNFWNTYQADESFSWKDVTETDLVEEYMGKGSRAVHLEIKANGKIYRLLTNLYVSKKDYYELLDLVARSTPQLDYYWGKYSKNSQISEMQSVQHFGKYARYLRS